MSPKEIAVHILEFEGDKCSACKSGILIYEKVQNCSCHINPPCSSCTDNPLICNECGEEYRIRHDVDYAMLYNHNFNLIDYTPRKLDNTKIDWRTVPGKGTHFTHAKEGVYPEGTTSAEVEKVVKGTFGGRFEYFGDGRFLYIAYTD